MGRPAKAKVTLDTTLTDLPSALRWREWMGRVEAVIFASREPVTRAMLAKVVGPDCNLDLIIDDIQAELRGRDADTMVATLLSEDAQPARGGQTSDRSSRRLFERLVSLGVVRELTGRPTFRLYGL